MYLKKKKKKLRCFGALNKKSPNFYSDNIINELLIV